MPNSHIKDFALEYCFSSTPPQYAMLLKGAWGSGKSWLIHDLIKSIRAKNGRELYVSLYGLNSFSAIEDEFYRKLHPILSSKGMEIAGKILTGTLKATLKVDLNADGNSDESVSIAIPNLNLPKYLKDTAGLVLIFDDIERCSINLPDLLGYINHFVEHQDYKVILVANEEELDNDKKYKSIKEKLIGKIFEVTPQVDEALDSFIEDSQIQRFYEAHRNLIKNTHTQSNYNNLRHLRQALLDFARIERKLPEQVTECHALMEHFLHLFLIFTFEIRHGQMTASDINNAHSTLISYQVRQHLNKDGEEQKPVVAQLKEKYKSLDLYNTLIEAEEWVNLLDKGIINQDKITAQLKNSKYLISKETPTWVRLWHYRDHTDSEFNELAIQVWRQLENLEITPLPEIKHVISMMLYFSQEELTTLNSEPIISAGKKCISYLRNKGEFNRKPEYRYRDDESAMGLQFLSHDMDTFKEFCAYIREEQEQAFNATLPLLGKELLTAMTSSPKEFSAQLYSPGPYCDIPVLEHIPASDFVQKLLELKSNEFHEACYFFEERYISGSFNVLTGELKWALDVKSLIDREIELRSGTLSGHCLKYVVNRQVTTAINLLTRQPA
ncbi:P-loop NTPase fold protein [Pseudomonas sp. NyZ480]|uniref:P-loop NTPase fold protein n=1 Tax=Pseudomonas sp. NyZ480 TaxID=3035289 RepID=UPI002409F65B|nr:P-loop NTPase fold protein [Pseudomonas sp. NyZ480]WEZ86481.1 P-loop NTPase fold protein [Pseudomonas sp. NyZ480]